MKKSSPECFNLLFSKQFINCILKMAKLLYVCGQIKNINYFVRVF